MSNKKPELTISEDEHLIVTKDAEMILSLSTPRKRKRQGKDSPGVRPLTLEIAMASETRAQTYEKLVYPSASTATVSQLRSYVDHRRQYGYYYQYAIVDSCQLVIVHPTVPDPFYLNQFSCTTQLSTILKPGTILHAKQQMVTNGGHSDIKGGLRYHTRSLSDVSAFAFDRFGHDPKWCTCISTNTHPLAVIKPRGYFVWSSDTTTKKQPPTVMIHSLPHLTDVTSRYGVNPTTSKIIIGSRTRPWTIGWYQLSLFSLNQHTMKTEIHSMEFSVGRNECHSLVSSVFFPPLRWNQHSPALCLLILSYVGFPDTRVYCHL
jgi:hypothetical protein